MGRVPGCHRHRPDRRLHQRLPRRDGRHARPAGQIGAPVIRRDNPASADTKPQPQALREAQKDLAVLETDWLIVLDSDEFINVKVGDGRLPDLLSAVPEGTEGVVLTWRIMGSNGITDWNPGLAIESYTRGAPDDFRKGWGVKTMFRPFPDFRFGIHRPTIKGAGRDPEKRAQLSFLRWVNGSGLPMTRQFLEGMWRSSAATLGYDLAEMAHFAVKSREAYLLRQIRGNVNSKPDKYDATYFGIFDRNETEQTGLCGTCPPCRTASRHTCAIRSSRASTRTAGLARAPDRTAPRRGDPSKADGAAGASGGCGLRGARCASLHAAAGAEGQIHRRQAAP
jgi:hypothetical protein